MKSAQINSLSTDITPFANFTITMADSPSLVLVDNSFQFEGDAAFLSYAERFGLNAPFRDADELINAAFGAPYVTMKYKHARWGAPGGSVVVGRWWWTRRGGGGNQKNNGAADNI